LGHARDLEAVTLIEGNGAWIRCLEERGHMMGVDDLKTTAQ
jgi:hypothetical protein